MLQLHEIELRDQIRAGNSDAFEALFQQYHADLFRFLWHMVRSREAAADLLQDLFLNIWKNRSTWHPGNGVSAYLFRAAKNLALNYLRDNKSHSLVELPAELRSDSNPADELHRKELLAQIQTCIDHLPEGCRTVFILSRYHDAKYKQIATALDISVKTVENHMGRALRLLRNCLAPFLKQLHE